MIKKLILVHILCILLPGIIAAGNFSFALITDLHVGNPGKSRPHG